MKQTNAKGHEMKENKDENKFNYIQSILVKYSNLNLHEDLLGKVDDSLEIKPNNKRLKHVIKSDTLKYIFEKNYVKSFERGFRNKNRSWYHLEYNKDSLIETINNYEKLKINKNSTNEEIEMAKNLRTQMIPMINEFIGCWIFVSFKSEEAIKKVNKKIQKINNKLVDALYCKDL